MSFQSLPKLVRMYCYPLPVIMFISVFSSFSATLDDRIESGDGTKSSRSFEKNIGYLSIGLITGILYPVSFPLFAGRLLYNKSIGK